MNYVKASILFLFFTLLLTTNSFSQAAITPTVGWVDPAMSHNRLIREQTGDGVFKLIGPYKVIGTSYLFGEKIKGNLFSEEAQAYNIHLSYNTYNQEVEFYSAANPNDKLIKEPGTVDSFELQANEKVGLLLPLKFVYGKHLGTSEKSYFQEIYAGPHYSIYKKYKSEVGYVSTNYVQSELRQFDLLADYYYENVATKSLKKLKQSLGGIQKELKSIKDVSSVLTNEAFNKNPEDALSKAFYLLNN